MADEKQICDPLGGEHRCALAEPIKQTTFEAPRPTGARLKQPADQQVYRNTPTTRMPQVASLGLLVVLCVAAACRPASAQFLFTYEINQESDDSRAPKSSLFDPSSFKIVTPSQLQSSYQKLAAQPPEQAPLAPPIAGATEPSTVASASALAANNSPASSSFLKQTSAAIQSLAELFNLSPSASPAPFGSQASGAVSQAPSEQQTGGPAPVDTQAEARSLHEHWTQQQQRAHSGHQLQHNQLNAEHLPALHSFTTSPSVPASPTHDRQHQHQLAPTQNSSPASYWLTASPLSNGADGNFLVEIKTNEQQQQQQQPQAQRPSQQSSGSLVDNLLSLGQPQQQSATQHFALPAQRASAPLATSTQPSQAAPAQSSFLSTPTSYYPHPAATPTAPIIHQTQTQSAVVHPQVQPQPPVSAQNSFRPQRQQQVTPTAAASPNQNQQFQQRAPAAPFQPQSLPLHQHQSRSLLQQPPMASAFAPDSNLLGAGQLRPPANSPQEQAFAAAQPTLRLNEGRQQQLQASFRPLKSAEESLLAFRKQQQAQHDQQSAVMAAQQQFAGQHARASSQASNSGPAESSRVPNVALGASDEPLELAEQPNLASAPAPTQRTPSTQPHLAEIPKVSPQIYESFLLQQKDQYEKHMELLKQQQELNKLLEQRQREEAEKAKRKDIQRNSAASNKKEELERVEMRKKLAARAEEERELQAARKARQEAEEARRKQQLRAKQEEEEKRRRAAEEDRRYREYLEARRKQEAEEAAAAAKAAAELKRERELKEQREREAREQAEFERRRKLEAEEAERREREQYRNYLRQQEELKKLLELKQREDEAARRRQAAAAAAAATAALTTTTSTSTTPLPADGAEVARDSQGRILVSAQANRLAQHHKERARQLSRQQQASGWGAPIRASRTRTSVEPSSSQTAASAVTPSLASMAEPSTTSSVGPVSQPTASPALGGSISASRAPLSRISQAQSQWAQPVRKLKADEKLIRQKIPNYTGAGKYGLYRSGNSSDTFADLVALLESVTLPSSTTTTTTTSSTTAAPLASSSPDDLEPAEAPLSAAEQRARLNAERMASSLSPLLNARDLNVTPAPFPASTGEPLASTTIFDDDVPRRPVRNKPQRTRAGQQQVAAASQNWPTSVSGAGRESASGSSGATRSAPPQLTRRSGSSGASGNSSRLASVGLASLPADSDNDGIPGRAGIEYPVLGTVPTTSFSCAKQPLNGYYADTETACQVVHLCQGGEQSSILCPNGTIFNQEKFSCQWWYEVNCSRAPIFYQLNDNLYKSSLKAGSDDDPAAAAADDDHDQAKATTATGALPVKDLVKANKQARTQPATSTNNL